MITYELAKKLKESGFPQNMNCVQYFGKKDDEGELILTFGGFLPDPSEAESLALPTFSELIEACGDSFSSLHLVAIGFKACGWDENGNEEHRMRNFEEVGSTPEEAVANLWLALQNK